MYYNESTCKASNTANIGNDGQTLSDDKKSGCQNIFAPSCYNDTSMMFLAPDESIFFIITVLIQKLNTNGAIETQL